MRLLAQGLSVRVGGTVLLDRIDLDVAPGEIVAVAGPNGAGKSTLLGALAGDFPATAGRVHYGAHAIGELDIAQRARLRGVVGAPPQIAFDFTVEDVVAMGWLHGERYGRDTRRRALAEVLEAADIAQLAGRTFATLSSGEQQRAQFARALLQIWRPEPAPRWLLLDEPTANLDIAHGIRLLQGVRDQTRHGVGALAVLHDLNLALRFADRLMLLHAGRAIACGPPDEVAGSELLSRIYDTPVHVEHNTALDRLVVLV